MGRGVFFALALCGVGLWMAACGSSEPIKASGPNPPEAEVMAEAVPADTVVAIGEEVSDSTYLVYGQELDKFQPPVRTYDLLHTTLDLTFDFPGESIAGTATHQIVPLADDLDRLHFDARDFEIDLITLSFRPDARGKERIDTLRFDYDGVDLTAYPAELLDRDDTVKVAIRYAVAPMEKGERLGMIFIDGAGVDPSVPTQAWTIGQPEDNQHWFPTWDYPNDFATYDLLLSVPSRMTTVSNGMLVEQTDLGGGMRRDRWSLAMPHPSYLTAVAVGEYVSASDTYQRPGRASVPLTYYVEPAYQAEAKAIYGETPRMMALFEEIIGVPYPWQNYKQVPVRRYTAGGMENTTLSIYTNTIQNQIPVPTNTITLLAHELAHQWFGDLVSGKDWAHLPLNEGFAAYFEEVYLERSRGAAAAAAQRMADRQSYFAEAAEYRRPLIWYGYGDPNQLFDSHSYAKAARVLGQLRFEIGDAAFWDGVRRYLRGNRHEAVDLADLQTAMEVASGEDLDGFFEQWFRQPGHPELEVTQGYDSAKRAYTVRVRQVQDKARTPVFSFLTDIELNFFTLDPFVQRVRISTTDTTFAFGGSAPLAFVRFDAGSQLFADVQVDKPADEWVNQARRDDEMAGRLDAVAALAEAASTVEIRDVLLNLAQSDPELLVREAAVRALEKYGEEAYARRGLLRILDEDTAPAVRRAVLQSLGRFPPEEALKTLRNALSDRSPEVQAAAVVLLAERDATAAWASFAELLDEQPPAERVAFALTTAASRLGTPQAVPYLTGLLDTENDALRGHVVRTLAALGDPSALSALQARLAVETFGPMRSVLQQAIAELEAQG